MSDPTYTPPNPPDPNASWSNVHNPAPGGQYPPQGQYPPPGYQAGQYPPPQGQYPPQAAPTGLSSGVAAGLSYLFWPVAIVFLIIEPYKRDPLVRFSAMQTLTLLVATVALSFIHVFMMFFHIPFLGLLLFFVFMVVWLAIGICWLIAMIKAFSGQKWKIPVIGDLAENFSRSI